ncbi:MAG: hypothetical protein JWN41_20 [Thermoleophilia bacterium]|nr:hypothetical protein [Thermoleophilia bacterium]
MTTPAHHVRVLDTHVRPRSPIAAALWCVLTIGISGAVRYGRVNAEMRRLGRARGAMPFAFIRVRPVVSGFAWLFGFGAWVGAVAALVAYVRSVAYGNHHLAAADITGVAGCALFLVPLWLTVLHTGQRLQTTQHLVGELPRPGLAQRLALLAALCPPAGLWRVQHEANRAWQTWSQRGASTAPDASATPASEVPQ